MLISQTEFINILSNIFPLKLKKTHNLVILEYWLSIFQQEIIPVKILLNFWSP